ncbi:hypothetical protein ACTXJX_18820 [Glutamicibacter ardleyensis]|uniref:hypothetical protein n=1 Tax=Glutamicibacter ardleyensis TaxID=225894 RepID=UPI003FD19075
MTRTESRPMRYVSMEQNHCCHACNKQFPAGSDKRRKYCDDACRKRQKRASQRATRTQASPAEQLAAQNEQLRTQLSRAQGELAKVHDRAMRYRSEAKAAGDDLERFIAERQRSLDYFQDQHRQLRAKYRHAHTLIAQLGHRLNVPGTDDATWTELTATPVHLQRGPLPSDNDNTASLIQLVAQVSRQLDDMFGLRHQRPRTRRDNDTALDVSAATPAETTTPDPAVADALTTKDNTIKSQREIIAKADTIINTMSERLNTAKAAHSKLRAQYTRVQQTLASAKEQREQHRIIVTQWRLMARELYRRTSGRPTEKRHQEILATMNSYEAWAKGQK